MTQRRRVRPRCNPGCPGAPAIRRPVPPPGGRHRYPVARPYSLQSLTERKSYLPLQVEHRHHQMFLDGLDGNAAARGDLGMARSEEHTSEHQSLMRISYAVLCLKKKKNE